MGLQVHKPEGRDFVVLDEKVWLTADRERLVPDGHGDAAYLFGTPGKRVDAETAKRYGLAESEEQPEPTVRLDPEPEPEPQPEPEPEEAPAEPAPKSRRKRAAKTEDKQAQAEGDKSA